MINNNYSQQISFSGRNKLLKDADWVCRKVNSEFPAIMPNRLYYENSNAFIKNQRLGDFIQQKFEQLSKDRDMRNELHSPYDYLKVLIYHLKEHKVAQCKELASLAELVARINGVKNCNKVFMKNYDHTFLVVSKNAGDIADDDVIIDPWLGLSGRVSEVLRKYKTQYAKLFPIAKNENLSLLKQRPLDLDEKQINYFRRNYQKLIFNSNDGHDLMSFDK